MLLVVATFTACEKDISKEAIGIEKVYIPEAISASTTNNNYAVPGNINYGAAKNFRDDSESNKVQIFLGVSKSGKQTTTPFTVNVISRPDTISQLITNGATFLSLPAAAYTLPANVSLAAAQSIASFNLVVDKPTLKTYAGKKVAVCVALSNPTNYMLNANASKVVVIIDVDALKLK